MKRQKFFVRCLIFIFYVIISEVMAITVTKVENTVQLDGKLDKDFWKNAHVSTRFVWLDSRKESRIPARTDFRILVNSDAVFLGVYCEEPMMLNLQSEVYERDSSAIFKTDHIEIFIAPDGKNINYYQFAVNPENSQWSAYWIEGGNTTAGKYGAVWESAVYKGSNYWSAEVKIPLSSLYYTEAKLFSDKWKINLTRQRLTKQGTELTTWSPLMKKFHEIQNFNIVSGLPEKNARYDIRINSMKAIVKNKTKKGLIGDVEIGIEASSHISGEYFFSLFDSNENLLTREQSLNVTASKKNSLVINGILFPFDGKSLIKAVIKEKSEFVVNAVYYSLPIIYEPLRVDISEPFYSHSIYPGQKVNLIKGIITCDIEKINNAEMHILGNGPDGYEYNSKTRVKSGENQFNIDATSIIANGNYKYTFRIFLPDMQQIEKDITIRKLAEPSGSCVYIDNNLNFVADGKIMFARGWFATEKWMVSEKLLHTISHPDTKFHNIWNTSVDMTAERIDPSDRSRIVSDVKPSDSVFKVMRQRILENRENNNIFWYYLSDEPECRGVSPVYLKYQYDFIKESDPYHPVMVITREPGSYTRCADILSVHPYINPNVDSSGKRRLSVNIDKIRQLTHSVLSNGNAKIVPWFNAQVFSYNWYDLNADYPTFEELFSSVFTAIVSGSKGITLYMYNDHFNSIDMRLGSDFIFEILSDIEEFLINPAELISHKIQQSDSTTFAWIKKVRDNMLTIVVNSMDIKTNAIIESDVFKKITQLHEYRENNTIAIQKEKMIVDLEPYQVRFFSEKKIREKAKNISNFRQELLTVKSALKKKGNILFEKGRELEWDSSDPKGGYNNWSNPLAITLTDGICDALGWKNYSGKLPAWIEMSFPTFVPKFRSAKIYAYNVEELEFRIWKAGEWQTVGTAIDNGNGEFVFSFANTLSTIKIVLTVTKCQPGKKSEIYEIELYN